LRSRAKKIAQHLTHEIFRFYIFQVLPLGNFSKILSCLRVFSNDPWHHDFHFQKIFGKNLVLDFKIELFQNLCVEFFLRFVQTSCLEFSHKEIQSNFHLF
jgi:hypothetical protein